MNKKTNETDKKYLAKKIQFNESRNEEFTRNKPEEKAPWNYCGVLTELCVDVSTSR